ncbi:MAG: cohesin domain-containing protein [Candidatus Methanoperedens sp.]|nr:cohesin domain-containing protein [Candidatus Methanoperedens sp.]
MLIGNSSAVSVNIHPSNLEVTPGESFEVNVFIDPMGTNIAGAQLNLAFNKSIIKVNKISEGDLFKQNGSTTFFNNGVVNNSLGTVTNIYDVKLGKTNVSTPGIFIVINMTALDYPGSSGINISNVKICDPEGIQLTLDLTNGSVIINRTVFSKIQLPGVNNLKNISFAGNYINWTWTEPITPDLVKVMVYINGNFKTNVTQGIRYYQASNLIINTDYTISTHTVDTSGNINMTWVNHTARTARDNLPPASITNLVSKKHASNYIKYTWADPSDADFAYVMVYINGIFKTNVAKGVQNYIASGLIPNTSYTISTHTVDTSGNINPTWINRTVKTSR